MRASIFEDLFVLELANNHWGKLDRGLKIVNDFAKVVRFNNVRAAIKLQFRDVDSFIHKDHRNREDVRYIKKTLATKLSWEDLRSPDQRREEGRHDHHGDAVRRDVGGQMRRVRCADFEDRQLRHSNDWVLIEKMAIHRQAR